MIDENNLKSRVAKEAATLLYSGAEKEYKQAKEKAAQTLGASFLPSNLEIAIELDRLAEDKEGPKRKEHLVEMRKEALQAMNLLKVFFPVLIGSVWRGTIRLGSDIDIAVYADDPEEILAALKNGGVKISKTAWTTVNKHGQTLASFHIFSVTLANNGLEIVVRALEEVGKKRKCETFGDENRGLNIKELQKLLENHPTKRFLPN